MNIYLISQSANDNYETYDAAVVVAESASKARRMNPSTLFNNSSDIREAWVEDRKLVKVKFIGTTKRRRPGVILASYHAG